MNLRIHFKLFGPRLEQEGIEAVHVIEHVEEFHILADALEQFLRRVAFGDLEGQLAVE